MNTSLASLVDNLSEINNKDCKKCMERNKIKSECEFIGFKDNRLIYKCKKRNSKSYKPISKLIKRFPSTYQFCKKDLSKFMLLLRKGVYMGSWERFNETELQSKESFYSELNSEHITDEDYLHAQKVRDAFEIKNLGEYHDLYVQSDTLLLADVFEKFWKTGIKIYQLDPAHFLKKTRVELLTRITDYDMFLMVESGIRSGICQWIHRYAKANINIWKITIKTYHHHT